MRGLVYILIGSLLTSVLVYARTDHKFPKLLKIGVIDTGLDLNDRRLKSHLCSTGHKDFTGHGLADLNGHGTSIAGLIEKYAESGNYCLLIYKYYIDSADGKQNAEREVAAIKEAIKNGSQIVNYSGGGAAYLDSEYLLIKNHPEVTFVVAAGNEGHNLDTGGNEYYPASLFLSNEIVVGSITQDGSRALFSNYGSQVTTAEVGDNVLVMAPGHGMTHLTGTSQATAIATGKLIKEMLNAN